MGYMIGGFMGCWRVARGLRGSRKRVSDCWVRGMEDRGRVIGCKCRVEGRVGCMEWKADVSVGGPRVEG